MSKVDYSIIEKFVGHVLADSESIISETENIEEHIDAELLDVFEFSDIRTSAEALQTLVIDMSESELVTNDMLTEIDDMSIELYQNIKYISEGEVFESNTDVIESFRKMFICVNGIRGTVKEFVSEFKV
jgi:hypothetical protein